MSFVETEINGQIMTIRLNRPERLNALSTVIRTGMAEAFNRFHEDNDLEVAILTGTGRGFCAGEDMKESIDRGIPGSPKEFVEENLVDPFQTGALQKPVIAAVNGFAMGGGFMLVERTDLRIAVKKLYLKCLKRNDGFLVVITMVIMETFLILLLLKWLLDIEYQLKECIK